MEIIINLLSIMLTKLIWSPNMIWHSEILFLGNFLSPNKLLSTCLLSKHFLFPVKKLHNN